MTTATLVDWTSQYFTYRAIWAAAVEMRECGERAGAEGLWSLLSAAVLANTAYEGFTDHLIESPFLEAWTEQRRDYRGRLGKTKFVAERLL